MAIVSKIKEISDVTHLKKPPYYIRKIKVYAYLETKLTAEQEAKIKEFFKDL
jgi:hypothetical protein